MNWEQLGKQLLLSSMVALLVFLMISVAFAQFITSTLLTAVDANSSLTTIIFLGFLVAFVVALFVNLLVSEAYQKLRVFYASLFAFLGNLLLWICISYFFILRSYSGLFADPQTGSLFTDVIARGGIYLFSIPRILSYYAIYILKNITLFWIYTLLSYTVFYSIFLITLGGK